MKSFVLFSFLIFAVYLNAQSDDKCFSDEFYVSNEIKDLSIAFSSPQPPPKGESRLTSKVSLPSLKGKVPLLSPALEGTSQLLSPPLEGTGGRKPLSTELKILSWNIYMLPPLIFFNGKRKRARAIGQLLANSDYDVIVFQEAFHHGARRKLKRWLKETYPYRVGPANIRYVSLRASSGVWILSKIPIKKVEAICFKDRSGFDNRMARKGALMIEGEKNGQPFQVIGTHLNAGGTPEVRLNQVRAIRDELMLPFQQKNIPQIICGDFNIEKGTDTYDEMMKILEAEDGKLHSDLNATYGPNNDMNKSKRGGIIDYIFYKNNGKKTASTIRKIPKIQYQWHKNHKDLADHNPVEIKITLF